MGSRKMARSHQNLIDERPRVETGREQRPTEWEQSLRAAPILNDEQSQRSMLPYRLARTLALASMVLGALNLAGWALNVADLQSLWTQRTRIPPNGGIIALLLGVALASKIQRPLPLVSRIAGDIAALSVVALGFLTLGEYVFGWKSGVDQWLFKSRFVAVGTAYPGRLSFPAALNACLLGLGLILQDLRVKKVWVAQVFAVIAALVTLLALIGHVCNAPEFYGQLRDNRSAGMPLLSVFGLLLLAGGLLCARPERGLMAVLWSYTPGGLLARWLLLAPAAGLFLTGIVYVVLTHVFPVDQAVRTWTMGLANLFFVTVPIWWAAQALHRMGLERERTQQDLEERVQQRTLELSEANLALHAEIRERRQVENALREARDRLEEQAAQLEQRVEERTAKLAETVGDLEAFSYSVAHDMRAPLRGMQGFAYLLLEEHASSLNPEARDYLDRIASSASRMDLLIQDALDYTQVLRAETELKAVNIDELARQLVATFPGWQPPRAQIEIVGTLPPALGHEGFMVQCLSNLIGNAVKFVAPGTKPRVQLWAESFQNHIRLYVEDNGIGIDPKDHDRIFRMFERINPAEEYEGTGIGLAVVRKAVERMKGRIDFESEPGRGSRFFIELQKAG